MTDSKPKAPATGTVRVQPVVPLAELLRQQAPLAQPPPPAETAVVREIGGRSDGPEPTRYGDWEKNGRCIDF